MSRYLLFRQSGLQLIAALAAVLAWSSQAAVLPPTDQSLEKWAAKRIVERPGLPPLETRSPYPAALSSDPAADTLLMLDARVARGRVNAGATSVPRALAQSPDNLVYATTFTAADGSQQEFAAHFRPDDARPLYLRASGMCRRWPRTSRKPARC